MLISKQAIRKWLSRPLRDSDKARAASPAKVRRMLSRLDPTPTFHTEPRHYQAVCFLLALKAEGYCLNLDMGLGKSKVALDVYHYRAKQQAKGGRHLVLVPNASNVDEWRDECAKHRPDLTFDGVYSGVSATEKERALWSGRDVLCMTFAGLLTVVGAQRGKGAYKLDAQRCGKFAQQFLQLTVDESSFVINHTGAFHRACLAVRRRVPYGYTMTGTPFGRNPAELWGQFRIADLGDTLGETVGLFRAAFFEEIEGQWSSEWRFRRPMAGVLARMIRHGSIRYDTHEVLDLPPLVVQRVPVVWPKEQWAYYNKLIEELSESQGNFQILANVFHRMRQLTGGFLYYTDPVGERKSIIFSNNGKLEACVARLRQQAAGAKAVVVVAYTETGRLVRDRLKQERIVFTELNGSVRDKRGAVQRFKRDPKCNVMVLQHQSGSFGLNLQSARYLHVLEGPTEPKARKQILKRLHRSGQTHTVNVYDYHVVNSIDTKILDALNDGQDLYRCIVEGKVTV